MQPSSTRARCCPGTRSQSKHAKLLKIWCRSEERRVGKECKSWMSKDQSVNGIRDTSVTGVQTCALPIFTVLGVSNVSFGLSKATRPVLNSVFLTHCLKAGLDAAIINPREVLPWNQIPVEAREIAEDLVQIGRASCRERV